MADAQMTIDLVACREQDLRELETGFLLVNLGILVAGFQAASVMRMFSCTSTMPDWTLASEASI